MQLPVVGWHTCHYVLSCECPLAAHCAVLDPYIRIVGRELDPDIGILYEECRVRLDALVHYHTLVDDAVLHGECRTDHLAACAIMMKFASRQRQDSHFQCIQFRVCDLWVLAQGESEVRIEVIELDGRRIDTIHHILLFGTEASVHEQTQCFVRQYPYTDVHQEEMLLHELTECLYRWFLQHVVELVGVVTSRHEDSVVLGKRRIDPQAVTHHIGIRNVLKRCIGTYIHVATHNHRLEPFGSFLHNLVVERQLQVEQVLRQFLSAFPSEHGDRSEYLARRRIARQPSALSACVQNDTTFAFAHESASASFLDGPCSATARTEFRTNRVVGTEPFVMARICYFMKTFHKIRWKRE